MSNKPKAYQIIGYKTHQFEILYRERRKFTGRLYFYAHGFISLEKAREYLLMEYKEIRIKDRNGNFFPKRNEDAIEVYKLGTYDCLSDVPEKERRMMIHKALMCADPTKIRLNGKVKRVVKYWEELFETQFNVSLYRFGVRRIMDMYPQFLEIENYFKKEI